MITLTNHYSKRTTYVFKLEGKTYVLNGCCVFEYTKEECERVYKEYEVGIKHQESVSKAVSEVIEDLDTFELMDKVEPFETFLEIPTLEIQRVNMRKGYPIMTRNLNGLDITPLYDELKSMPGYVAQYSEEFLKLDEEFFSKVLDRPIGEDGIDGYVELIKYDPDKYIPKYTHHYDKSEIVITSMICIKTPFQPLLDLVVKRHPGYITKNVLNWLSSDECLYLLEHSSEDLLLETLIDLVSMISSKEIAKIESVSNGDKLNLSLMLNGYNYDKAKVIEYLKADLWKLHHFSKEQIRTIVSNLKDVFHEIFSNMSDVGKIDVLISLDDEETLKHLSKMVNRISKDHRTLMSIGTHFYGIFRHITEGDIQVLENEVLPSEETLIGLENALFKINSTDYSEEVRKFRLKHYPEQQETI